MYQSIHTFGTGTSCTALKRVALPG